MGLRTHLKRAGVSLTPALLPRSWGRNPYPAFVHQTVCTLTGRNQAIRLRDHGSHSVQHFIKLTWISMLESQQMSACELFNRPSLIRALRAEGPLVYCLHNAKLYASLGFANISFGVLMTKNMLLILTNLVSNCIGQIDLYGLEDNLMNPTCHQGSVQTEGASALEWSVGQLVGYRTSTYNLVTGT
ncbi:uncharacterized protein TNCV_847111 [Trichonephila clavipes]|nr:uncharacterized protein TNCV_847111 [Trichonephila clavipes]